MRYFIISNWSRVFGLTYFHDYHVRISIVPDLELVNKIKTFRMNQNEESSILGIYSTMNIIQILLLLLPYISCVPDTVCPRSSNPVYIVSYYIKLLTTSWI